MPPQLIYFHIHTKPRGAGPVWRCRTIFQLKKRRRDRSQGCNRSPGWDESIEEARPVSLRCFTRASSPCEYFVTGDSCVFVRHGFSRAVTGDLGIVGHGFSRAVTDGRNTALAAEELAQVLTAAGRMGRSGSKMGTEKWNCEPRPTALSTQMRPPCTSTMCLAMDRPRPVPPASRERAASTR